MPHAAFDADQPPIADHAARRARGRFMRLFAACAVALVLGAPTQAMARDVLTDGAIPGVAPQQLDVAYWIERTRQADHVLLDTDAIATQNAVMRDRDDTIQDIAALPVLIEAEQVRAWIEARSARPSGTLYDVDGKAGTTRAVDNLVKGLNLPDVPQTQVVRFGLVVRRADLRTFPTHLRVFNAPGDTDIDRFQEDALFPGTAVAIVHESRDDAWLFVVSERYSAWIERDKVAIGDRDAVLDYARRGDALVVTGATARTVFTPENPAVSDVQLEMGVRVPLVADWPAEKSLNGQIPYYGHVVELPVRSADGSLSFAPALVPRSADVSAGYLPYTRANVLRQAFKFLGERYGWGHAFNARDCSGFVSEIYRSFGILMPRNTSAQAMTPALDTTTLDADVTHAQRVRLLRDTQVGDLLYLPGHVMLVIGQVDGEPYVIHDTAGMSVRNRAGDVERLSLNGVVVTAVTPMLADAQTPLIDRITHIQRIRR